MVSSRPRKAGDIYPADMVGGSLGRLEPSGTRGAENFRSRGLVFNHI